jgi:small subunit ribosomal protein S6
MTKSLAAERPYESLFICPLDASTKTVDAFVEKLKSVITNENGKIISVQNWGRRRLTFPIKRQKEGIYMYIDWDGSGKSAEAANALFRVTDVVLRHMTVLREDFKSIAGSATPSADGLATAAVPVSQEASKTKIAESPSTK